MTDQQRIKSEETIQQFAAGDKNTFALVFHQYYLDLCFFAKRIIDKPRIAENIVEDAFIALWNRHPQFTSLQAIKIFLYNTIRDACFRLIDQDQQNFKDQRLGSYVWQETSIFMEKEIIRPEIVREIHYNLVDNLPPACKRAIARD
ncbi:MAG: sigma factor [Candidatus Pseudobacter hemicellulosilyticus]|uniref:Sigma factor n=1 Tax=Candidatus Pseudobacter hemicellulosilyticus TaxID=3121375 RepID=A0AAJ5WV04_9BACT|nr:MAG: sigma factor [Pseudobacter sp.]